MSFMDEFERGSAATDEHARLRAQRERAIVTALDQAAKDFAAYAKKQNLPTVAFAMDSRRGWVFQLPDQYHSGPKVGIVEDGSWAVYGMVRLKRSWLWETLMHYDYGSGLASKDASSFHFINAQDVHEKLASGLKELIDQARR